MPDRVFTQRHQKMRVLLDSIIVVLLLLAVYSQNQQRDLAHKISAQQNALAVQQQAFINEQKRVNARFADVLAQGCVASNGARVSLKNLLIAADTAAQTDPSVPADQKLKAHTFYQKQIDNIKLTDCSKYQNATGQ